MVAKGQEALRLRCVDGRTAYQPHGWPSWEEPPAWVRMAWRVAAAISLSASKALPCSLRLPGLGDPRLLQRESNQPRHRQIDPASQTLSLSSSACAVDVSATFPACSAARLASHQPR